MTQRRLIHRFFVLAPYFDLSKQELIIFFQQNFFKEFQDLSSLKKKKKKMKLLEL